MPRVGVRAQTAPLQALIICNTISAAPRLCSRDCWYRSLCFSISFSWGWVGAGFSAQQPSLGPQGLSLLPVCLSSSSYPCHSPIVRSLHPQGAHILFVSCMDLRQVCLCVESPHAPAHHFLWEAWRSLFCGSVRALAFVTKRNHKSIRGHIIDSDILVFITASQLPTPCYILLQIQLQIRF